VSEKRVGFSIDGETVMASSPDMPADIAAAIDRYRDASRLYFHRMSEDNAVRMCDARAALDAAILARLTAAEWLGYRNGLQRAGNMHPRIPYGDEGGRMVNHLRDQIDAEIAALVREGRVAEES
jgi:hypothetical protein